MSDLEPIQRSRLSEIGQILSKARQEKGLTLEEVSGKTLIRAAILKAIEEGDARPLPEPVYIRGFIRRFGDLVGLNGMELCDSFPWQPSGTVPLSFVSAGAIAVEGQGGPTVVEATPEALEAAGSGVNVADGNDGGSAVALEIAAAQEQPISELPEQEATEAAGFSDANAALTDDGAVAVEAAQLDEPAVEVSGEALADIPVADIPVAATLSAEPEVSQTGAFEDAASTQDALIPDGSIHNGSVQDSLTQGHGAWEEANHSIQPTATPNHETAYESRAALFGDETDLSDGGNAVSTGTGTAPTGAVAAGAMATGAMAANSVGAVDSVRQVALSDAAGAVASESASPAAGVATLPTPPAPVTYREPEQRSPLPWILAAVAAVVGLGVVAIAFGGGNRQDPALVSEPDAVEQVAGADSSSEAAGTVPEAEAEATASNPAEPAAQPAPPAAAVPADKVVLELEVKGTETAWMDVFVDGTQQIEGIQEPGFKQRWEGSREIDFATARPDLVWVSINGGESKPFGEAPSLKTEIFRPANAQ